MAQIGTLEGTWEELKRHEGELAGRRFRLVPLLEAGEGAAQAAPLADPENAASIALLQTWLAEDATDDPDELAAAERELEEFKRGINAERERAGAGRVYP